MKGTKCLYIDVSISGRTNEPENKQDMYSILFDNSIKITHIKY